MSPKDERAPFLGRHSGSLVPRIFSFSSSMRRPDIFNAGPVAETSAGFAAVGLYLIAFCLL
jgi:hypothetical protein